MRVNAAYTIGLGAAAMFLLDPDRGRRRRAWLRDQCVRACRKTERAYETARRDLGNRATGVWARTAALFRSSNVSDVRLLERVRAQIGRAVSHPHDVHVEVRDRWALLSGTVSPGEAQRVLSVVERVPGIRGVQHRLVLQERPATEQTPSRSENRGGSFELTQNHWSPTARLLVGAAGSILTIEGLRQGGVLGSSLSVTGIVLLLRGVRNQPYRELLRRAHVPEAS